MTGAGGLIDVIGYKYRKDTSDANWGIYAPDNQENFDYSEYQRQKEERAEQRAEAERLKREAHRKEALPIKERDKHYRRISSYLGLSTEHKQDLLNRGLNESQIEKFSSFTVNGITELPDLTPLNLPCVRISKTGEKYFSSYNPTTEKENFNPSSSYFCPAFDFDGNIIGGQFRHKRENNKYTWLKGIKNNKLPNGETPITIVRAEQVSDVKCPLDFSKFGKDIKPFVVLEGLLKAFISTCIWGIDSIGASGFNFGNSLELVSDAVKRGEYNLAIFPLDAGLIKNDNLLTKLKKNIELFESLGCQIVILWWGQLTKESPDFDELKSLDDVKLLTKYEFKQVLIEEKLEEEKRHKLFYDLQYWLKCQEKKRRKYYKSLKKRINPDLVENNRYCTAPYVLNNIPDDFWGILNLISAKGTGKSTVIGSYYYDEIVDLILPDKTSLINKYQQKGYNVISLSLRIALSEEQAHRWNLKFINSDNPKQKYKFATEYTEIALVIDSLLYLVNRSIDEKLVLVIDEVKSFITHLLTSSTLKENRHLILKQFEKIIKLIYENKGLIILSDADMGEAELNYFQNVSAKVNNDKFPSFTYENTFKHEGREVNLFEKKSDLLTVVHNLLKQDKKLIFPCDSIKEAQALAEVLIKDFPKKKIFSINSESVENDDISREFVTKPNESVKSLKPDVLLYTNSMGMGVSIDIAQSFDYVICLADGTLTPDGVRQAIWRYRELIDILLYCPTQSHRYNSDIPFNIIECHKRIEKLSKGSIKVSELLKSLYDCDSDYQYYQKMLSLFDENKCLNDPHLKQIARIYSMQNYEFKNYRECILDDLEKIENNKVITNQEEVLAKFGLDDIDNDFGKDSREQKSENKKKHSHNLSGSKDISFKDAVEMSKRFHLTPEQRLQVEKAFLKHRFGDLADDPEFCFFATRDGGRNLNKIAFEFFCQNFEISKFYDRKNWHDFDYKLHFGNPLLTDVKQYSHCAKLIKNLRIFGIIENYNKIRDEFDLNTNRVYPTVDNLINPLRKRILRYKKQIKDRFNLTVNKNTDMLKFVTNLLKRFGYDLKVDPITNFVTIENLVSRSLEKDFNLFDNFRGKIHQALMEKYKKDYAEAQKYNPIINISKNVTLPEDTTSKKIKNMEVTNFDVFDTPNLENPENNGVQPSELSPKVYNNQGGVEGVKNVVDFPENEETVTFMDSEEVPELPDGFLDDEFYQPEEIKPTIKPTEPKTLIERFSGWFIAKIEGLNYSINQLVRLRNNQNDYKIIGFRKQEKYGGGFNIAVGIIKAIADEAVVKFDDILFVEPEDLIIENGGIGGAPP